MTFLVFSDGFVDEVADLLVIRDGVLHVQRRGVRVQGIGRIGVRQQLGQEHVKDVDLWRGECFSQVWMSGRKEVEDESSLEEVVSNKSSLEDCGA